MLERNGSSPIAFSVSDRRGKASEGISPGTPGGRRMIATSFLQDGSGFGVYHALTGVAALGGGIGLGVVFQSVGGSSAFVVSAAGTLGLVILWPFWTWSHRVPPP